MKFLHLRRAVVCGVLGAALGHAAQPPATPKRPVTDVYHGVKVVDNYRWLEDFNAPGVHAWADAQTAYARSYLDAVPARAALYAQLKQLLSDPSPEYYRLAYRGDVLFAMKSQPPKEQPFLITLESPDKPASERIVVDPNRLDSGGTTAIDFHVPSTDGKLVAVSLSEGGSESGDVHIFEVATGKALADVIPRVNGGTAGGSLAWNADGSGFYYTRYPRGAERPKKDMGFYQQVYLHRLGTKTEEDAYSLGKDFPRIAEIALQSSSDGRWILATMANGDGGEFAHYLLGPNGEWRQIAHAASGALPGGGFVCGHLRHAARGAAPNGAFNVTEFGTVKELDQFRALYAYSPYHDVVDGTQYPAVFFLTGDNDPRVDPANSRKMTARLQASGTGRLVLLRTSGSSGHGIGTGLSEQIAEKADAFAFLFDQLGVK